MAALSLSLNQITKNHLKADEDNEVKHIRQTITQTWSVAGFNIFVFVFVWQNPKKTGKALPSLVEKKNYQILKSGNDWYVGASQLVGAVLVLVLSTWPIIKGFVWDGQIL